MRKRHYLMQQDEYMSSRAQELAGQLNLLADIDVRVTPEYVAGRFRELLDKIAEEEPSGAGSEGGAPGRAEHGHAEHGHAEHGHAEHGHDTALSSAACMDAEPRRTAEPLLDKARREGACVKAMATVAGLISTWSS